MWTLHCLAFGPTYMPGDSEQFNDQSAMPIALDLIRASEFIRFDAKEHLDFEETQHVLERLAIACRKRGLDRAMLDLRMLPILPRPHFSANELAMLVGTFQAAGFSRKHRLAIIYRSDAHGGIRTFAFLSKIRGLQVQAFNNFESALEWLSGGYEDSAGQQQGATVPIVKRDAKKRMEDASARTSRSLIPHSVHNSNRMR